MIALLTMLLATMSATLLVTLHQRGQRAQVAAEIPPGYKIHAAGDPLGERQHDELPITLPGCSPEAGLPSGKRDLGRQ